VHAGRRLVAVVRGVVAAEVALEFLQRAPRVSGMYLRTNRNDTALITANMRNTVRPR